MHQMQYCKIESDMLKNVCDEVTDTVIIRQYSSRTDENPTFPHLLKINKNPTETYKIPGLGTKEINGGETTYTFSAEAITLKLGL